MAVLQRGGLNLTAVTVTAEENHTVAFLGTSDGRILKVRPGARAGRLWKGPEAREAPHPRPLALCPQVYLAPNGTSEEYGSILVEINKRIKRDLVLSGDLSSLYAMTQDKVSLDAAQGGHPGRPVEQGGGAWPGAKPVLGLLGCGAARQGPSPCLQPCLCHRPCPAAVSVHLP